MLAALLFGVAAFTLVYTYLMTLRLRVGRLEERAVARGALTAGRRARGGRRLMDENVGYVVAGYAITAVALGGYVLRLFARAREARRRAESVAMRRRA